MIDLILAKEKDDKDLAKVFLKLHHPENSSVEHILKLHQDKDGVWHPELKISLEDCNRESIFTLCDCIETVLTELKEIISSTEQDKIYTITKMVGD